LPSSTLIAWFDYNRTQNDPAAKTILYPDFCEHYTFHKGTNPRAWKVRQKGFGAIIGRIYSVTPREIEKFHLRMLLYKIPGADLRTFEGVLYPSFQSCARAMGLLVDDYEWFATLTEASSHQSPQSLRQLFSIILVFCECSDPYQL
jgi:hypothetical protein